MFNTNQKLKVYFANGLFSEAERVFNSKVVNDIRHALHSNIEVFLPQEAPINDKSTYADSKMIAQLDTEKLLEADILVAVLDGVTIDAGVASEIGAFYTTGKPIIGLYTDIRRHGADNVEKLDALKQVGESQWHYLNLYTVGLVKLNGEIVTSTEELVESIKEIVKNDFIIKTMEVLNDAYNKSIKDSVEKEQKRVAKSVQELVKAHAKRYHPRMPREEPCCINPSEPFLIKDDHAFTKSFVIHSVPRDFVPFEKRDGIHLFLDISKEVK